MAEAYVVTEDEFDCMLLQRLLPEHLVRATSFEVSRHSAPSLSRTILAVEQKPVALLVDAHTNDETAIQERTDILHYLLQQAAAGVPFRVFLAVPEIETVFFQDQALLERLTHTRFTEREWKLARLSPKAFLTEVVAAQSASLEHLVSSLSEDSISVLQQHPLVFELSAFLDSVAAANSLEQPSTVSH